MDLLTIKPSTVDVHIKHPGTGANTGLVLEIASRDSDVVKAEFRRQLDKGLQRRSNKKMTADEIESRNLAILAASVTGWRWEGDASWGGKKLDYTKQNVLTVLSTSWVRKQVEEEADSEADFFQS
ncbi:hypothetical protein ASD54_10980 [Rhizobium sp. Root149]|uniref:hypothetical protein n=1 Tax=Rhizobium sp. Root149 TaxID=1736473 RepID=UPI0007155F78|nr:hypothetical protein [Rhizobium sp. Root149]KQZ50725.1 hypothetical protein ASD54_10980 [Rhizobium sp. Root149]